MIEMSEFEKKERLQYRAWRKKRIMIQFIVAIVLACMTLGLFFAYTKINKELYLQYTEKSDFDYRVQLVPNEYYEDEYLGREYSYVTQLIDKVKADFTYEMEIEAADVVRFDYTYKLDAVVEIMDRNSERLIYDSVHPLKDAVSGNVVGKKLSIGEALSIDYDLYDTEAQNYIAEYELSNVTSTLRVRARVNIIGVCAEFAEDYVKSYETTLAIPLNQDIVKFQVNAPVPQTENLILMNTQREMEALKIFAIIFAFLTVALFVALLIFARITSNKHIEYNTKVQRIVSNYRSYIQKISNVFDPTGYQIIGVTSFVELLEIRDTLQSPILMLENTDKTCTKFIVPADTKILYLYEIKVED